MNMGQLVLLVVTTIWLAAVLIYWLRYRNKP